MHHILHQTAHCLEQLHFMCDLGGVCKQGKEREKIEKKKHYFVTLSFCSSFIPTLRIITVMFLHTFTQLSFLFSSPLIFYLLLKTKQRKVVLLFSFPFSLKEKPIKRNFYCNSFSITSPSILFLSTSSRNTPSSFTNCHPQAFELTL